MTSNRLAGDEVRRAGRGYASYVARASGTALGRHAALREVEQRRTSDVKERGAANARLDARQKELGEREAASRRKGEPGASEPLGPYERRELSRLRADAPERAREMARLKKASDKASAERRAHVKKHGAKMARDLRRRAEQARAKAQKLVGPIARGTDPERVAQQMEELGRLGQAAADLEAEAQAIEQELATGEAPPEAAQAPGGAPPSAEAPPGCPGDYLERCCTCSDKSLCRCQSIRRPGAGGAGAAAGGSASAAPSSSVSSNPSGDEGVRAPEYSASAQALRDPEQTHAGVVFVPIDAAAPPADPCVAFALELERLQRVASELRHQWMVLGARVDAGAKSQLAAGIHRLPVERYGHDWAENRLRAAMGLRVRRLHRESEPLGARYPLVGDSMTRAHFGGRVLSPLQAVYNGLAKQFLPKVEAQVKALIDATAAGYARHRVHGPSRPDCQPEWVWLLEMDAELRRLANLLMALLLYLQMEGEAERVLLAGAAWNLEEYKVWVVDLERVWAGLLRLWRDESPLTPFNGFPEDVELNVERLEERADLDIAELLAALLLFEARSALMQRMVEEITREWQISTLFAQSSLALLGGAAALRSAQEALVRGPGSLPRLRIREPGSQRPGPNRAGQPGGAGKGSRKRSPPPPPPPHDILMPGGRPIGVEGTNPKIRVVPGGDAEARGLFDRLTSGASPASRKYGGSQQMDLPGGGWVGLRQSQKFGTTLDIDIPGIPFNKVHFK